MALHLTDALVSGLLVRVHREDSGKIVLVTIQFQIYYTLALTHSHWGGEKYTVA